jgi:hypothetical protein
MSALGQHGLQLGAQVDGAQGGVTSQQGQRGLCRSLDIAQAPWLCVRLLLPGRRSVIRIDIRRVVAWVARTSLT